jgi:hypothetical protein
MKAQVIHVVSVLFAAGMVAGTPVRAEEEAHGSAHVMVRPADRSWADGPASLPPGTKVAVIEGDPTQAGPFTLRLRLPARYRIPPHWHPADEHVTVIAGAFHMGLGESYDASKGKRLPVGSFAVMPAKTAHFAFTKEPAVIQLHGIGPWGINYVNPSDDPRKE